MSIYSDDILKIVSLTIFEEGIYWDHERQDTDKDNDAI